ncbi:hypothetical protein FDECE_11340 [Fusarium decemcellulare]|nr:hypothetical protein FDECE_11340 [Fusarium decemcellulare]
MSKTIVAFDLYGTLLSTESIAKKLESHFGADKAKLIAALWRRYQLEYTWRLNSMSKYRPRLSEPKLSRAEKYEDFSEVTRKSLQHALGEHNLSLNDRDTENLMEAYDNLSTFPDVNKALSQLESTSGIECVVFSNGTNSMVSNSVNRSTDLYSSAFTDLVTVDEIGVFKPAPEAYKHLARKMGKEGSEHTLWLVSGNPFDIVGARAVGMQAAWVDRAGNGWVDALGDKPTVIVRSLEEVVDKVQKHKVPQQ